MAQGKQVYAQDWSCIFEPIDGRGGLYIGNLEAAQNMNTLRKLQIKALLTAAKGIEIGHPRQEIPFTLYVPADDHESFDISRYFNQAAGFINDCLQKTNIMVHCLAGVSRSVSLVLAYLIKHRGMSYSSAYDRVKSRRRIIHPNDGFIDQLRRLQREQPPPNREETKSLSPQKGNRLDYSISMSPSKQRPNIDSIISKYDSYTSQYLQSKLKNPQINTQTRPQMYSPERSSARLKRFSSMNTDYENTIPRRPQVQQYSRGRVDFEVRAFGNAQNRIQLRDNSDIDRRIEEIRKKYQQYVPSNLPSSKYNNYMDDKGYRPRTTSSYADYKNSRDQNSYGYVGGEIPHKMKRLTSLQEY